MKRPWLLALACAFGLACAAHSTSPALKADAAASSPASQKVSFRRTWQSGNYLMSIHTDMAQTIKSAGDQQQKQNIKNDVEMALQVAKPNAQGDLVIGMEYKRFVMKVQSEGMAMAYDSNDPPEKQDPNLKAIYGPMLGAQLELVQGPDGTIKSASGLDKMWDKLIQENKNDPQMAQTLEAMKKQMGDDMLKQMISPSAQSLPARPVAVGESWSNDIRIAVPVLGPAQLQMKSTLKEVQPGPPQLAMVEFAGTLKTDQPTTAAFGPAQITINKMDMKISGATRFNLQTGMPQENKTSQSGSIEMIVQGPQGQSQSITMEQNGAIVAEMTNAAQAATAP
jgi:hypothetical protein